MDLLDLLAEVEAVDADDGLTHIVYPNMSLVCGRDLLEVSRAANGRAYADRPFVQSSAATCPGCTSAYSAEVSAGMQRRQAVIRS